MAQLQAERSAYITDSAITPNGRLLCFANGNRVDLYTFSGSFSELEVPKALSKKRKSKQRRKSQLSGVEVKVVARIEEDERVTALAISDDKLYYATNGFHVKQSDFAPNTAKTVVHKRMRVPESLCYIALRLGKLGDILKMKVNESSTYAVALTAKCQVFTVRLEEVMEEDDETVSSPTSY